jgi:hypothetical protein
MTCADLIIIILIFLIVRMMFFTNKEGFRKGCKTEKKKRKSYYCKKPADNEVFCDRESYSIRIKDSYHFTEMQYHPEYMDLLSVITNISEQKQLFNRSDKPVENTKPNKNKTKKLLENFIDTVNDNIVNICNTEGKLTGWDKHDKLKSMKSGWDKHMEQLGLPSSVYSECKNNIKSELKLLEIHSTYALETDCDMRITCIILCKKKGVHDKVLMRVNFWIDNNDINNDREFFKDNNDTYSIDNDDGLNIVIEDIFILGYFVRDPRGNDKFSKNRDKFYHFDNIEKDGMIDQKQVLEQLMKKQKERANEISTRICSLGKEDEKANKIPHLSEYNSYKNTRTIFDDIDNKEEFDVFNNNF